MCAARTHVMYAVWGIKRKARVTEVVLGLVNDPIKIEPMCATVFKELKDVRRMLINNSDLKEQATRVLYKVSAQ